MRTLFKWGLVYLESGILLVQVLIRSMSKQVTRVSHWWFYRIYSPFHFWNDNQQGK